MTAEPEHGDYTEIRVPMGQTPWFLLLYSPSSGPAAELIARSTKYHIVHDSEDDHELAVLFHEITD